MWSRKFFALIRAIYCFLKITHGRNVTEIISQSVRAGADKTGLKHLLSKIFLFVNDKVHSQPVPALIHMLLIVFLNCTRFGFFPNKIYLVSIYRKRSTTVIQRKPFLINQ